MWHLFLVQENVEIGEFSCVWLAFRKCYIGVSTHAQPWELYLVFKLSLGRLMSTKNIYCRVVLAMGLYYYGLRASSPSYSVNFLNLIPIVTFVIAIILRYYCIRSRVMITQPCSIDTFGLVFRLEKLGLGSWSGKMKALGAAMCVGGTMMVSLLKGRLLHLWPTHLLRYAHAQQHVPATSSHSHHHQSVGTFFLCGSCLSYALWFIVQVLLLP